MTYLILTISVLQAFVGLGLFVYNFNVKGG